MRERLIEWAAITLIAALTLPGAAWCLGELIEAVAP